MFSEFFFVVLLYNNKTMSASQVYSSVSSAGGQGANCTCLKGAYQSLVLYSAQSVTLAAGGTAVVVVPGAVATDLVVCTRTSGATATTGIGAVTLLLPGQAGANYTINSATAEAGTASLVTYRLV
jgi:hypothetical protein